MVLGSALGHPMVVGVKEGNIKQTLNHFPGKVTIRAQETNSAAANTIVIQLELTAGLPSWYVAERSDWKTSN